jgi:hypothetical protein
MAGNDRFDPWSAGAVPATPMEPVVPVFGTRKPAAETNANWISALGEFGLLLPSALVDPRARVFASQMRSPLTLATFQEGFTRGCFAGALRALADWIGNLQETIAAYTGELPALTLVAFKELLRGITEENPTGLTRDTQLVLDAAQLTAPLQVLALLTVQDDLDNLLLNMDLVAADILTAFTRSGREWIDDFFANNGDPPRQGVLLGEMYGSAVVETLRFWVESLLP